MPICECQWDAHFDGTDHIYQANMALVVPVVPDPSQPTKTMEKCVSCAARHTIANVVHKITSVDAALRKRA